MRGPPSGHRESGNLLLLTYALAFLSFLGYFGSDASSRAGDALNTIFILLCGEECFPLIVFPFGVLCALSLGGTRPVVLGTVLYTESIKSFALKIKYFK